MKLIDTHTHVQFNSFKAEATDVIARTLAGGVWMINVGTQIDTSREAVAWANNYTEGVYAVVGLHPEHTYRHTVTEESDTFRTREEKFNFEAYKQLALNSKVVGIGECGLDYFWFKPEEDILKIKTRQRQAFLEQIKLALEVDKVLCIHCRPSKGTNDAYGEIYEIIKKIMETHPQLRFEVHCYTGNLEYAKKFTKLGGFLGLNGIITFDKTGQSEDVVKNISLDNIILETDAPYLAPVPFRGKRNEPLYVEHTARKIAGFKGISLEEVAEVTTKNARQIFRLT